MEKKLRHIWWLLWTWSWVWGGKAEEFGLKIRKGDNEETILSYKRDESLFIFDRNESGIGPKGERKINVALKIINLNSEYL